MTSALQIVKSTQFNGIQFDCYTQDGQQDTSDFWATRTQIGQLLGYDNPRDAIAKIHRRNKERLGKFSSMDILSTEAGQRTATIYNFKGLLEICRFSNQPKADAVMDFLWEIADEIRRTGSYSTKSEDYFNLEKEKLKDRKEESVLRQAELLTLFIEKNPLLPKESKAVLAHEFYRLMTGHECLAMLPEATEARYTATELGKMFGVSANKIGRIAKKYGLKSKQGEKSEYGTWICDKSRYSNHECLTFVYNDKAIAWFEARRDLLHDKQERK